MSIGLRLPLTPASADLQGLERFGAGGSRNIVEALLPDWHEQTVRARAAKLLGTEDLSRYAGWRGDRCYTRTQTTRRPGFHESHRRCKRRSEVYQRQSS